MRPRDARHPTRPVRSRSRSSFSCSTPTGRLDYENENEERERYTRSRAGFTLIELLAVVALIGVFTIVSASLFRSTLRWATSVQRESAVGGALRHATDRLRADVWNSYEINVGDERTLLMRQAGDRTVVWVIGPDPATDLRRVRREVWRRPPMAEAQTLEEADWPLGEIGLGFERSPAGLTLWRTTGESDGDGPAGRRAIRMMSQIMIEAEAGG